MLFIETPIFTKQASGGLFTDEELEQLQQELLVDPNKGDLIAKNKGYRMDKELFNELKNSIRQMKAIREGDLAPARVRVVNPESDVAKARQQLGMTQEAFAKLLDTPIGTVRGWEQGRRQPPPSAKVLIRVATKYPEQVLECAEEQAGYNGKS